MLSEATRRTVCQVQSVSETNVMDMAIQKRARGGRPSKGDRHVLTTRLPVADAEKLFAVADHQGQSASEFIADAVAEKLAAIDMTTVTGQEELPIGRIAS
jgi:hypothetical protein